ncbi:MAG: sigma-70 family RNA polymerase sigma factor [Baekduia sp.]
MDLTLELARMGDDAAFAALANRYRPLCWGLVADYYAPGLQRDDFLQAARVGLWKAVHDWRPEAESSFGNFARLCITREVITALKAATRNKHAPLNQALSLSLPQGDDDDDATLGDILPAAGLTADEMLELASAVDDIYAGVADLSRLERWAVEQIAIDGVSYDEAATAFGEEFGQQVNAKAIDNALQRARRRLRHSAGSALAACP